MNILSIQNVVKQYHNHTAVDDVTFNVEKGKIFGLLGPNGAGKTSLIRIITGITGADQGRIMLDGEVLNDTHPSTIGYMPEERGLYKKMKVGEQLLYLAQLKNMPKGVAKAQIKEWFVKFGIEDWWGKKVDELSKGMQQKIQFIATVLHKPKLLILDEPFSGLDPLNANLIKDEIYELNKKGTSIIFSTHRMEQVEEICEDIVLMNKGKLVLEGSVADIKEKFKKNIFKIKYQGDLTGIPTSQHFTMLDSKDNQITFSMEDGYNSNELLSSLISKGIDIKGFEEILPSLNEIFIDQVNGASA